MGDMAIVTPAVGRYIIDSDDAHHSQVAMIGPDISDKLFPGLSIHSDERSKLMGVPLLSSVSASCSEPRSAISQDAYAYIPIETFIEIYGSRGCAHGDRRSARF